MGILNINVGGRKTQKGNIMKKIEKSIIKRQARKALTRTILSVNAEEIKTDEFIKECEKHHGLTIQRMDRVVTDPDENGVVSSWYAVSFVELPNKYYNGGYSMTKLAEHLKNALCENEDEAENFVDYDLSEYELKITARMSKNKNNQPFVEVALI